MNPRDLATPVPGGADPAPPVADDPSLTRALQRILRHHGSERTALSLFDGLPFSGRPTPLLAARALTDAGYRTRVVRRRPDAIHAGLLPAILLMRDGRACVLLRRTSADGPAPGRPRREPASPGPSDSPSSRQISRLTFSSTSSWALPW